jgi:hypothetical protein
MSEEQRKVPAWRRVAVVMGWIVLATFVGWAAMYVYTRNFHANQLAELLAKMDEDDPHWRWNQLMDQLPPIDPAEDNAPLIDRLASNIPTRWPEAKTYAQLQKVAGNRRLPPKQRLELTQLLSVEPIPEVRRKARVLTTLPKGRIPMRMDQAQPQNSSVSVCLHLLRLGKLYQLDAWDLALEGQFDQALDATTAALHTSHALDENLWILGQMVRLALVRDALKSCECTLALGEASADKLKQLQTVVQHQLGYQPTIHALRGERALAHEILSVESEKLITLQRVPGPWLEMDTWYLWYFQTMTPEYARREHATVLKLLNRSVAVAELPLAQQTEASRLLESELSDSGVVVYSMASASNRLLPEARRTLCSATALHALLAVERYRLQHGKWPGALADCVPAYLEKVPVDPMDEKPLRYKILPDGVVVYSVGENQVDDGGDIRGWKDAGFRLWNLDQRGVVAPKEENQP